MFGQPRGQPRQRVVARDQPEFLYAVYCTARLPKALLEEFIRKSRHDVFPLIMTTKEGKLTDYTISTKLPLGHMEFPFLGWEPTQVARTFRNQVQGISGIKHGSGNFVILDERTATDKTCLIANCFGTVWQTLRSDFDMALEAFMGPEVMAFGFDELHLQPFYYGKMTVTRARFEAADGSDRGGYSPRESIRRNKHLLLIP